MYSVDISFVKRIDIQVVVFLDAFLDAFHELLTINKPKQVLQVEVVQSSPNFFSKLLDVINWASQIISLESWHGAQRAHIRLSPPPAIR